MRGINVSGKTVKMEALKKAFSELGFEEIQTLLASGNVVFLAAHNDEKLMTQQIEEKLRTVFGFEISLQVRPYEYIKELVMTDPFKRLDPNSHVKCFVTFLASNTKSTIVIPFLSPDKTFEIISMTKGELFHIVQLEGKTTDAMEMIDKKFGKKVTTRNWNTIKKIAMLQ